MFSTGPAAPQPLATALLSLPRGHPQGKRTFVVLVEAVISEQGRIETARVLGTPSELGLDSFVAEALRQWRFAPAQLHGKPVAVYWTLTLQHQTSEEPAT